MGDSNEFKVLLYSDGSCQAFSAAIYTITLLKNMPNMNLTIVQTQEKVENSLGTEDSWLEMWPVIPTAEWVKRVLDESDAATKKWYAQILAETNEVFSNQGLRVNHQVIYSSTSIPDTVNAILDFARNNSIQLIIMGTRGLTHLQGLIFGSLAYTMLSKSDIPVLLVKKLPKELIGSCHSDSGR